MKKKIMHYGKFINIFDFFEKSGRLKYCFIFAMKTRGTNGMIVGRQRDKVVAASLKRMKVI